MEIVREQPPEGQRYHDGVYQQLVAGEAAPYPLMHASRRVCQANPGQREVVRKEFPTLEKVRVDSPQYVDEDLWLTSQEAGRLLEELRRLRRVCRWEEFIHGLDGQATYEQWREGDPPGDFDLQLDRIEVLLGEASANGYWVRLML